MKVAQDNSCFLEGKEILEQLRSWQIPK